MKTLMMTAMIAFGFAAPALADSVAEDVAKHDFETSFVTDPTLGKTSPAEIYHVKGTESGNVISTKNRDKLRLLGATKNWDELRLLGADGPAEIAAARR